MGSTTMFEKSMMAGWSDMDFSSHMRNTAFLDKAGDVRMLFLSENGFPMSEFMRLQIGPVVMKDEIAYFKEVMLLEEITVTLGVAGMSADGSRWMLRTDVIRSDGKLAAWESLQKTDDFVALDSSIK